MARSGMFAVIALVLLAGAHAQPVSAPCTAAEYIKALSATPNLKTTAKLLGKVLTDIGGAPTNSTVFAPTDKAWKNFKLENGAAAPETNKSVAIFLYNSIIGLGLATQGDLAAASPVQTSAGVLQSYAQLKDVALPISVKKGSAYSKALATSGFNQSATLGVRYEFCGAYTYAIDGVLIPAKTYATVSSKYPADIAAVTARASAPAVATAPSPDSAMVAGGPTPAPAPSAATAAVGSAVTMALGLVGAATLLLA